MERVYQIFLIVSGLCASSLPIITFLTICVPKIRGVISKHLRKFLGLNTIDNYNEELKKEVVGVKVDITNLQKDFDDHKSLDELKLNAQMCSLKDSLMKAFYFYNDRGWISLEEFDELQKIYDAYTSLKGNGMVKHSWEKDIKNLPNRPVNKQDK